MKSDSYKRVLLVVLVIILAYVWWDAFDTILPSSGSYSIPAQHSTSPVLLKNRIELAYKEPVINPFQVPQRSQKTPPVPTNHAITRPNVPPRPADTYQLAGIIKRGTSSQAVVVDPGGVTQVLSIGDSLSGWSLYLVGDDRIIFRHDKVRDTIVYYKTSVEAKE